MRLSNTQAVSRPTPADRNPTNKTTSYAQVSIAPHALTTRWSYTVPAGRKAIIQSLRTSVVRNGVATAAGEVDALIQYTPSGGSTVLLWASFIFTNGLNDSRSDQSSGQTNILAGDTLAAQSQDLSTGGSANLAMTAAALEFDA